jgi:5-methylcytosine-specific restriction enzyme subunit McrC
MILLNFHPDVTKGKDDVVALMFDMNVFMENLFIIVSNPNTQVCAEDQSRKFW